MKLFLFALLFVPLMVFANPEPPNVPADDCILRPGSFGCPGWEDNLPKPRPTGYYCFAIDRRKNEYGPSDVQPTLKKARRQILNYCAQYARGCKISQCYEQ